MPATRPPPRRRDWSWKSQAFRGLVYQILAVALIGLGVWYLAHNTVLNMRARGIQSGFEFLLQPAGFDIGESLIPYDALDPFWKAFLVGILVSVPFMATDLFAGPIGRALNGADLSYFVSFLVAGGIYIVMSRFAPSANRASTPAQEVEPGLPT